MSQLHTGEDGQEIFNDLVSEYQDGRDEMNLAEFPIAALSNRPDPGAKTIVFKDRTFDRKTGLIVERQLTVSASDRYGLPASLDDEVILGLLQLSRLDRYRSPHVRFSRYQLLRILGWADTTKNYRRLEEALNRWLGVTLYYVNAWRDRASGEWRSISFHLLDMVEIFKPGRLGIGTSEGGCSFKWNDIVFKSLCDGNLKALDFQTYRLLKTPVAKRLFRFLDKRFHQRSQVSFDVERFAYEKLGLSRSYRDVSQIKRCLLPGILELEKVGFIRTIPQDERFTKKGPGLWEVHFERHAFPAGSARPAAGPPVKETASLLEERLQSCGVSARQAKLLASKYPPGRIEDKIEALEYLLKKEPALRPRNPAGYLAESIRSDYAAPEGFKTVAGLLDEQEERKAKALAKEAVTHSRTEQQRRRTEEQQSAYERNDQLVKACLEGLSDLERTALEERALQASPIGGHLSKSVRHSVIWNYTLNMITELQQSGQQELEMDSHPVAEREQ